MVIKIWTGGFLLVNSRLLPARGLAWAFAVFSGHRVYLNLQPLWYFKRLAALLSLNIDPLPTSQGHADAQCLQMDVNNCQHHNSGLSPENLSRALKDAGAPTFPNFSLLVSNHLAEWPELFLGKRRECLAAVSSTEQHQREYRYTSSQPQERRCHSQAASYNFSLVPLPTPKTLSIASPVK